MLQNIEPTEALQGLARAKSRDYETKTVNSKLVDDFLSQGWVIDKRNQTTTRLRRNKAHGPLLEDRVWTLLYRMRFENLSSKPGAVLGLPQGAVTKIDVVGVDHEIALAIECKSSEKPARRPSF